MTKAQMMHFKASLETKRHELVRELRTRAGGLTMDENGGDPMDQVQSMNQRDKVALTVQWLSRVQSDVNAALRTMTESAYGLCVECGEPISLKRLETIPWASHCIGCQAFIERREAAQAGVPLWGLRVAEHREAA